MRPLARLLPVFIAAGLVLAGCDWSREVKAKINPDSIGLADRCADILRRAMPFVDIDIAKLSSKSVGISRILAEVDGTRQDMAKDAAGERDLAVECQFDSAILTGFRWLKGAPPNPQ
jgi:hypothetical protein